VLEAKIYLLKVDLRVKMSRWGPFSVPMGHFGPSWKPFWISFLVK